MPKTNHIEFCRLIDKINGHINEPCNIEVYRTTRITIDRKARVNISTPSNYKDGTALGAKLG